METIRNLTHDELDQSLELSQFAFQYVLSPEEMERRKALTKPEQIWGYFVDGQLAAKMHIFDFETWVNGKKFAMGGIAGVATWPEYRRQGMVGKLLRHGLQLMKERGQPLSYLHPFAFEFYRRYGWETFSDYKKYELEVAQLPNTSAGSGRVRRIEQDWQLFNSIYEQYAARFSGTLVRFEEWWQERIFHGKKGPVAVYETAEGELTGYLLYQVKEQIMTIDEMVFLNEEARAGLWKFIRNHDSMIKRVTLKAPVNDPLAFLLEDPRIKQEVVPYFMARIVDVKEFLQQYPFLPWPAGTHIPDGEREFTLQVQDSHAPWNEGVLRVTVNDQGEAQVTEIPASETDEIIRCNVGTLTALLLGYQSPRLLSEVGRLQGSKKEVGKLVQLIPSMQTYLPDFF